MRTSEQARTITIMTQFLLERTGEDDRVFEPIPPAQISDLQKLREELDFVNWCSESMMAGVSKGESW